MSTAQTPADMRARGEWSKQTGRDQAWASPDLELISPSVQNMLAKTDFLWISKCFQTQCFHPMGKNGQNKTQNNVNYKRPFIY